MPTLPLLLTVEPDILEEPGQGSYTPCPKTDLFLGSQEMEAVHLPSVACNIRAGYDLRGQPI